MLKFIAFLKKIYLLLLFIGLEAVAIRYYAYSDSYTKAKLISLSNTVMGGVYSQISGINTFFSLKQQNEQLLEEIAVLKNTLEGYHFVRESDTIYNGWYSGFDFVEVDTLSNVEKVAPEYLYTGAKVINNTISHQENYITINKGVSDGIEPNMALVSNGGIVGYVAWCSDNFSICVSVLNRDFNASGKIKGSDFFGALLWDGNDSSSITLTEVPKYANLNKGDTILTTSYSSRFPPDIIVGMVDDFELNNATFYDVKVKLHSNIASLTNVLVVKYLNYAERNALEAISQNPDAY